MQSNFASAATRHLSDVERLVQASRWDNAAYLAGYVCECSLKAVVERAGSPPRLHLDAMDERCLFLAADLSYAARRYPVDLDADLVSLRRAWKSDLRYSATGTIMRPQAEKMALEAKRVHSRTIGSMVLDGLYESVPQ